MSSILNLYTSALTSGVSTQDETHQASDMAACYELANLRCIKRLLHALLKESLLPYLHDGSQLLIPLKKPKGFILIEKALISTQNRFTLSGEILLFTDNNAQPRIIDTPEQLLRIICHDLQAIDPQKWQHFVEEISNHIENDALSLWSMDLWNKVIVEQVTKTKHQSLIEWLLQSEFSHEIDLFFEQWIAEGHPYHPCAKTKLGLTRFEALKYSPEFHQETNLSIAAIHQSLVQIEQCEQSDYKIWFANHFADINNEWQQACIKQQLNPADYAPIPIHPWQEQHTIKQKFAHLLEKKLLVIFSHIKLSSKPTLSFRTVIPSNTNLSPHIKLPVAVQTTSAVRTVSPNSTENGPKISKILQNILEKEKHFAGSLNIMREQFGLHVNIMPEDDKRHLSCLYRENARKYIANKQLGIVVAALFEISPVSQVPLIIELMQLANATDQQQAIIHYFREYTQMVLQSFLTLYLRYGIALEGHQQNTLAVFEKGKLHHLIARDFGGVRIHLPTLKASGYTLAPYPNSATIVDQRSEARKKCLHTTYQYHLGELIHTLATHFNLDESLFWQEVAAITIAIFNANKQQMDPSAWQQDYDAILKNEWDFKALLRMRLADTSHQYIYVKIPNPLVKSDKED